MFRGSQKVHHLKINKNEFMVLCFVSSLMYRFILINFADVYHYFSYFYTHLDSDYYTKDSIHRIYGNNV